MTAWIASPGNLPRRLEDLHQPLALLVLPPRRPRRDPRVVEIKMSDYREREVWQERLGEWRRAREQLAREFASDPQSLAAATEAARAERFDEAERRRVEVLETLDPASSAP